MAVSPRTLGINEDLSMKIQIKTQQQDIKHGWNLHFFQNKGQPIVNPVMSTQE